MADDELNLQDFYDHAKRAEQYFADRIEFRHHRNSLKDFLHWMDRSGVPKDDKGMSPGAKAANKAAAGDNEKEFEGRMKIVDDRPREDFVARPVGEQPTSFQDAADAAHEQFVTAVTGKDKE